MLMCQTMLRQDCNMLVQRITQNQNIVTLSRQAKSLDLAPIEHVWRVLGRNVRCYHDVITQTHTILTLSRKWVAIPQNGIRISIG